MWSDGPLRSVFNIGPAWTIHAMNEVHRTQIGLKPKLGFDGLAALQNDLEFKIGLKQLLPLLSFVRLPRRVLGNCMFLAAAANYCALHR
jgi:hypothetical protein